VTGDCHHCKDYRECVSPPGWFHYGLIRWCPYQCIWIIRNASILRAGQWPKDPDSVDDNAGQRKIKTEASFAKPILILAEVEARLDRTDNHGELLITQIEDGRDFNTLSDGARAILMYVKGARRKRIGFRRWKREVWNAKNCQKVPVK